MVSGAPATCKDIATPDSMPYGGGLFQGRERIAQRFAEDLWELWAEFSSTPPDLIDGRDKIVVPVHVKARTHTGNDVEVDNVWIYEFDNGELRRARVYADTAAIRDAVVSRGSTQ
jgi:ketosteroid isomerase-like protein